MKVDYRRLWRFARRAEDADMHAIHIKILDEQALRARSRETGGRRRPKPCAARQGPISTFRRGMLGQLLIEGEHAFIDSLGHHGCTAVIIFGQTCMNDPKKSICNYGMAVEQKRP